MPFAVVYLTVTGTALICERLRVKTRLLPSIAEAGAIESDTCGFTSFDEGKEGVTEEAKSFAG